MMDRAYVIRLHRDERHAAKLEAQLFVAPDPGEPYLLADVSDDLGGGILRVLELVGEELLYYQDDHGELP